MKKEKKRPWSLTKKIVLSASTVVLAVGLFIAGKYIYQTVINPIDAFSNPPPMEVDTPMVIAETPTPAQTAGEVTPEPTVDPDDELRKNADMEFMKNRVNVLLLGLDESAERANWGTFRTDTMIVLSVDFATKDVYMVSIPRDSYVKIYNSDKRAKANSAFVAGGGAQKKGFEYACKTVSAVLGNVPINYYVGFNMPVVKDVVNAMGGVDYVVDIDVSMNGRTLKASEEEQHLDGQMVLDYCRMRKGSSDIARVDRQQRMLFAIFGQLKRTKQIANIPKIFQAIEQNIGTNLNFTQISALALFATGIEIDNLQRYTLPGQFLTLRKTSFWGISETQRVKMIKEVFGITATVDPSGDVSAIKAEIEANRALIAGELSQASAGISQCKEWLAQYELSAEEKSTLNATIKMLQEAYDSEDKAELDEAISYYQSIVSYMQSRLGIDAPASTQEITPAQTPTPEPAATPTPTPTPNMDPSAPYSTASAPPSEKPLSPFS